MEKDILTNEQLDKVCDTLNENEKAADIEKLKSAEDETNTTAYSESEKTESTIADTVINESVFNDMINSIVEDKNDYIEALSPYGLSDEEAMSLFNVITQYKLNKDMDLYNKLPDKLKIIADSLRLDGSGIKVSKNVAAKYLIDSLINDAKFNKAIDEYTGELNDIMLDTNKNFQNLIQESINEVFDNIEDIRSTDPEKAKQIEDIHNAFERAKTFDLQLEFIRGGLSAKKLNKFLVRYDDECFYFNKKVNNTEVKVPDIKRLYPIIKRALPGFTDKQIKSFIIIISKSIYKLDMNDIVDVAYVYRLISNITSFEFNTDFESDYAKEVFGRVTEVIQEIIKL